VNTVWVPPSATSFSCLCETCLDRSRVAGELFSDAIRMASVRGQLDPEADAVAVRCAAGHELVVRRIDRPPALAHHDARQLQIS
jgi:hypothetical protein